MKPQLGGLANKKQKTKLKRFIPIQWGGAKPKIKQNGF